MQITAPIVAAVILAVVLVFAVLLVAALCRMALRRGLPFRADIRAPSFSLHVSTNHRPRQGSTPGDSATGTMEPSEDG